MTWTIRPVTPELWPALESLFNTTGPVGRCWCMYWRIGADYRRQPPEENKAGLQSVVENGPPPGLLAFDGDQPIGWCQLTPRSALPWLMRSKRLQPPDDRPVWSLSCFYIHKNYRRQGVMTALIEAAIEHARAAGAPALEAYPFDASLSPSASSTGYLTTFLRAGFVEVQRHIPPRPIVRYELGS